MDVSTPQEPELQMDVSTPWRGLCCCQRCLQHQRGLSCTWTCLNNSEQPVLLLYLSTLQGLCCTRTCLHTGAWMCLNFSESCAAPTGFPVQGLSCPWTTVDMYGQQQPVLLLDLCTQQRPVLYSDLSTHRGLSLTWTCLHCRVLGCTWTSFLYRGLSCTSTCVHQYSNGNSSIVEERLYSLFSLH